MTQAKADELRTATELTKACWYTKRKRKTRKKRKKSAEPTGELCEELAAELVYEQRIRYELVPSEAKAVLEQTIGDDAWQETHFAGRPVTRSFFIYAPPNGEVDCCALNQRPEDGTVTRESRVMHFAPHRIPWLKHGTGVKDERKNWCVCATGAPHARNGYGAVAVSAIRASCQL